MRQAVLVLVVAALYAAGLAAPEVAILSYIWFNLMRPDAASFSTLPFSIVLASVALVSSMRKVGQVQNLLKRSLARLLLLQQVFVFLSVLFAVNMDLCWENFWAGRLLTRTLTRTLRGSYRQFRCGDISRATRSRTGCRTD